ncbi:hypothetical protein K1T71_006182 [Dendrolimus kikuchii]|uniref:Uncharacterized protein n=1 Tax=Dendrolimus kikuchii TaxID=765133 RepID=A0ACC1D3Q2_9NEOP|nr:hypothetical protein K1T71_006182 [Dendrolimus kikuchii]
MLATMAPPPESVVQQQQPSPTSESDPSGLVLPSVTLHKPNNECKSNDINDVDLFKNFPVATSRIEYPKLQIQDDTTTTFYPPSPPEVKPSPSELANVLLQQLDDQFKQENILQNWLEEKVDLPIYDNFSQVPERVEPSPPAAVPVPAPYALAQPTEDLLREFDTVYGVVQLEHLTPPQSPPGPATQLLVNIAQNALAPLHTLLPAQEPWPVAEAPASEPVVPVEYECDLEAVDELVRRRAAQLVTPQPSAGSLSGSPRSSPPSSPRSSTDDEWSGHSSHSRPKPYSRSTDDRRSRKKEQNKNAATRYRQKKKAEVEVLLNEEQALRQHHSGLSDKCADLQRDIRYLKGLMRDMFKAKGLIK